MAGTRQNDAPRGTVFRRLQCERLEPRCLLAGVTVWTHGFNGNVDGWIRAQADAILDREDLQLNQPRYRIEVTDPGHDGGPLEVETATSSGPSPTATSTSNPEFALLLDWSDVAGTAVPGGGYYRSTSDVAAAVAQRLAAADLLPDLEHPIAALPLHLIGHSRGGSLVGELAHQLGQLGIWVDQVTTLDPHPVDGVREPLLTNYDFGDAPMTSWENVVFWDNYWRTEGALSFDFTGEPVANAADFQLSESVLADGGYASEHLDVPLWYHGTIDTSTNPPADDGWVEIPNHWYDAPHPSRDSSGFAYSRVMGKPRTPDGLLEHFGGDAVRQEVDWSAATWPNLLAASILPGETRTVPGDSLSIEFDYQDADSSATVRFQLDADHNPFNTNEHLLGTTSVDATLTVLTQQVTMTVPEIPPGTYHLLANISDEAGQSRSNYAPQSLLINRLPTLAIPADLEVDEDAGLQEVGLTGISAGGEEQQPLRITTHSDNPQIVPHPEVDYLSPDAAASLSLTPLPNATGTVEIQVTVEDGGPDQDLATPTDNASLTRSFTVLIRAVNDVPTGVADAFDGTENQLLVIAADGVLANDQDVEEDPLQAVLVETAQHGQLTLAANGGFEYLPDPLFNRVDHFQYRAHDGVDASPPTTVHLTLATAFPWYNGLLPNDVNDDGITAPNDAITGISRLNKTGATPLSSTRQEGVIAPFLDVNRDGHHAPIDILMVVSALNRSNSEGEGEALPPGADLFALWAPNPGTLPATSTPRQNGSQLAAQAHSDLFRTWPAAPLVVGLPPEIKNLSAAALRPTGAARQAGSDDLYSIGATDTLLTEPLPSFLTDWLPSLRDPGPKCR
ncbi:MAG: Ig-like domain-containing protein [Planctomycetota bacterium]|nr:Ig-like domain-containing protein [Planctomycetota bacterium]